MNAVNVLPTALTQRTDALVARVDAATEQLLARFSAIAALSMEREDEMGRNASTAAATSLQIQNHAYQMVNAAEDLRTIVREVKEAWILGERQDQSDEHNENDTKNEEPEGLDERLKAALIHLGKHNAASRTSP